MANMFGKALRGIADNPQPDLSVDEVSQSMRNFLPISTLSSPLKGAVKYGRNVLAGITGKLSSALPSTLPAQEYKLPADYPAMQNKFITDNQSQPQDVALTTGSVGLPKMGRNDLSRMSDGTVPPTRRAPARPDGTMPTTVTATATATPVATAIAPDMQSASDRIYEYKTPGVTDISGRSLDAGLTGNNAAFDASRKQDMQSGISTALTPDEIKSYNIGTNGGIASMDGKTFVLPSRGAQEEKQYQAQQTASPITNVAQPAQQTSTVGYGHGVYELAQGQNAPPDFSKMSLGDMASYKFGVNQQVKQAGIANVNSNMVLAGNKDTRETVKLPFDIGSTVADTNYKRTSSDHLQNTDSINIAKLPFDISNTKAQTDSHLASAENSRSQAQERNFLAPAQATKLLADAAESQQRVKALLAPAAAKGSLTEKDIMDGAHADAYKSAVDMIKNSMTTDPIERQKEFDRYYHDGKIKFLTTYKQMTAGAK